MTEHIRKQKQSHRLRNGLLIAGLVLIAGVQQQCFCCSEQHRFNMSAGHYNEEELFADIFEGHTPNTLLYYLFRKDRQKEIAFVEKYDVDITSQDRMLVTVYEKPVIGYISYMGCNMYFDREGMVVESSTKHLSGIPEIAGVKFKSIVLNSKLQVSNAGIFDKILELTQGFDKYNLQVDKIYFDASSDVTIHMGDVKILLGDCSDVTDQLYELKQMSAQFTGLKGTLHLEDYTKDKKSVVFQKEKS